jgi:CheY-like chemotaxis protein
MKRVLIVDDDPSVRRMLQLTYESAGYTATTAGNGNEALRALEAAPYDLMVVDIVMPEKEGIETIQEIRESRPELAIIAMSGGARFGVTGEVRLEASHALHLAGRLGASRCFAKPIDNVALLAASEELIAASQKSPDPAG